MSTLQIQKIVVLQFPGSNCENETVRSLHEVGLEAETFRWNRPLNDFDQYAAKFYLTSRIRESLSKAIAPVEATKEEWEHLQMLTSKADPMVQALEKSFYSPP